MKHLSLQAQQAIVTKALNVNGKTIAEIAKSHNIGYSTLQKWIKRHRDGNQPDRSKVSGSNTKLTSAAHFQHLVATAKLDDTALGAYCREHGLYSIDLKRWKEEFMTENNTRKSQQEFVELKALRAENKRLKQELRRKDSALAETTALLVLKKKANLIWGTDGEDP